MREIWGKKINLEYFAIVVVSLSFIGASSITADARYLWVK
jgi:hypothetical protein